LTEAKGSGVGPESGLPEVQNSSENMSQVLGVSAWFSDAV